MKNKKEFFFPTITTAIQREASDLCLKMNKGGEK